MFTVEDKKASFADYMVSQSGKLSTRTLDTTPRNMAFQKGLKKPLEVGKSHNSLGEIVCMRAVTEKE